MAAKEKKSLVNKDNYVVIQGWMLTDLKLKGNELIIYAAIYGFSQLEGQKFTGSLQYLADWTNSTKQGVMKCLKSLEEKGLIHKKELFINKVKFCEYVTSQAREPLNKVDGGMQQSLIGGSKQSSPNTIEPYNLEDNLSDKPDKSDKERVTASEASTQTSPLSLSELKQRMSPEVVEFMDGLIQDQVKTELEQRKNRLQTLDSENLEPSAFTKRLIKAGYIQAGDLQIGEYNAFFEDMVYECGDWHLVRNAVQYFCKTCKGEMRKAVTDRLAYLKTSVRTGVERQQMQESINASLYPFGAM